MITDSETNYLFLADCLSKKQPVFFKRFERLLNDCKIKFKLIPNTKDIWAVDYMPIQLDENKFVQFDYSPDYLKSKKWSKSITDVDNVCKEINISSVKSTIIIDGGNVVKAKNKVIMCDKVFEENKHINERELIDNLIELFEVEKIVFIPTDEDDIFGHADGMVRFIDNDTVLINNYSKEKTSLKRTIRMSLYNAGLEYIEVPYNPYANKKALDAKGIYINYLQMNGFIVVPTFEMNEDDETVKLFEDVFKGQSIKSIESKEIAKEGGILNCITWNIKK